ncbi:MAG: very short patch repair endonuclease [Oscillospiraceae bacterium]|nr:very short patch repair endonuclease [Oscillospiraceae bacterium]
MKTKSNREYWIEKIEENIARDNRNNLKLKEIGWITVHFWEKEVKSNLDKCLEKILSILINQIGRR